MATKKKTVPARQVTAKKVMVKKAKKKQPVIIDHFVSKKIADEMIEKGRTTRLLPPMQFSAVSIREILSQKGVVFLRVYAAVNAAGEQTYVLTGGSEDHQRIDVIRKKRKVTNTASRGTVDEIGDMNIAQVCDPVKQVYPQPEG